MSQIQVNHLTFHYDGSSEDIFDDVSFTIDTDWKLGLIGRNGRGKTTFLKLLMGLYEYRGTISSSVEFEYFPFPVREPGRLTMELIGEMAPELEEWKLFRELNLLETDAEVLYRPFETLSNGERTKIMLAALFLKDHRFLLIDEPTNHLDRAARAAVSRYLNRKSGFILVSHDRAFLDVCIDHVLSLNRNTIEAVQGNFTSWWENKEKRDASQAQENERLKKEIGRLREAAKRTEVWSERVEKTKKGTRIGGLKPDRGAIGHKAAKMMKRAKSTENRMLRAAKEREGLLKDVETADTLKILPLMHHKEVLVRLEQAVFGYEAGEESADPAASFHSVCGPLSFELRRGEKAVLDGRNGCGKSTVLKAVIGNSRQRERIPEPEAEDILEMTRRPCLLSGRLETASGLVISYVSQDTSWLSGSISEFTVRYGLDPILFRAILRKLDFSGEHFEKEMQYYSEGQKKKVLLAKSLCEKAHLYIWDEPLNYIDVFSRMQLEELLSASPLTMLFVEHDQAFTDRIAAKKISLYNGG